MGRAIDMENSIEKQEKRIWKLEGAVDEMIQLLENLRINVEKISKQQKQRSEDVKKSSNKKRTSSNSNGK